MKKIIIGLIFAAIMAMGIVTPALCKEGNYEKIARPNTTNHPGPYTLTVNGIGGQYNQWETYGTQPWLNDDDTNPANNYIQAPNNGYDYFCDGFDNTASWSHVGSYPYLNNDTSNYVYTSTDQLGCGYFSFPACSPTTLWVEAKSDQHASFTLLCNSFSGQEEQWNVVGTQPYLRYAGDGSYIRTPTSLYQLKNESRFGFDSLNLGTYPTGLDNATLIFTAKVYGPAGAFEVYGGDNGARTHLGGVYVDSVNYATFTLDVSSYFAGLTGSNLYNAINGFSIIFSYYAPQGGGPHPQFQGGGPIPQLYQPIIYVDAVELNASLNFQTDEVVVKYGGTQLGTMNLTSSYYWFGFAVSSVSTLYLTSSMGAYGGTIYVRRACLSGYPTSPTNYFMGDFPFQQMDSTYNSINSAKLYFKIANYFSFGTDTFQVRDGNNNVLGTITTTDSWSSQYIDLTSVLTTPASVNSFKMRLVYSGDRSNAKCPMITYAYLYVVFDPANSFKEISGKGWNNGIRWSGAGDVWTSIYLECDNPNPGGGTYLAEMGIDVVYDSNVWHFKVTYGDGSTWSTTHPYTAVWTPTRGGNTLESDLQAYSHNSLLDIAGWSYERYMSASDGKYYPLFSNSDMTLNDLNATTYLNPTANPAWMYWKTG